MPFTLSPLTVERRHVRARHPRSSGGKEGIMTTDRNDMTSLPSTISVCFDLGLAY